MHLILSFVGVNRWIYGRKLNLPCDAVFGLPYASNVDKFEEKKDVLNEYILVILSILL